MSDKQRRKIVANLKEQYQKIGKVSINDIINLPWMNFNKKVDYIRHNYTYYNGNEELFYEEDGKTPNSKKVWLNKLIAAVLYKKYTPDVLKDFNKIIMGWKEKAEKQKAKEEKEELPKYRISNIKMYDWIKNRNIPVPHDNTCNYYETTCRNLVIFKLYMQDFANNLQLEDIENVPMSKLYKEAKKWYIKNAQYISREDIDREFRKMKGLLNHISQTVLDEKEAKHNEKVYENYAIQKMREYDQLLKSKNKEVKNDE